MLDMLGPAHLRNMNKAFNALFNLDECAVIRERDDLAVYFCSDRIFILDIFSRMRLKLLVSE